jgi:hypothetical protein
MTQPPVQPVQPVQPGSPRRAAASAVAAHPVTSAVIAVLVIASIFFSLYVPLYASATPKVGDFPLFYFYLIIYMPAVAIVLWIVLMLQKRLRPPTTGAGTAAAGANPSTGEVAR